MKIYKLEVVVFDFEGLGLDEVVPIMENSFPLSAHVHGIRSAEIEWSDDHPLNKTETQAAAVQSLFP